MLDPLLRRAIAGRVPVLWINESWQPMRNARRALQLGLQNVHDAESRLDRFARLLARVFPELQPTDGMIESPLYEAGTLQQAMLSKHVRSGRWLIKGDHALPVAGSVKARGGIYEVLVHAEDLALRNGLISHHDDPIILAAPAARALFARHTVAVGSTGNLGLSIGIMAAALGFQATVHMSADAKEWKKVRLRSRGVQVIEHGGDYASAVASGRAQAQQSPDTYFVDDENSAHLFLGYSVAALRLKRQLVENRIEVNAEHPLFVYLPCGVGGAPGGITFGLRHVFGDDVHCFFAEPVASPCMLLRLGSMSDDPICVQDVGLDNRTEADGLAVGRASEFVARMVRPLVSGGFTVADDALFEDLYLLERSEGLRIEPSAAAGFRGPRWLLESEAGHRYLAQHDLRKCLTGATHILWTTGGALVPEEEYRRFHLRGENAIMRSVHE